MRSLVLIIVLQSFLSVSASAGGFVRSISERESAFQSLASSAYQELLTRANSSHEEKVLREVLMELDTLDFSNAKDVRAGEATITALVKWTNEKAWLKAGLRQWIVRNIEDERSFSHQPAFIFWDRALAFVQQFTTCNEFLTI